MNKGVNTGRGGKSSEETVLYCEGCSLGCQINTFSDINASHTHRPEAPTVYHVELCSAVDGHELLN